MNAVWKIARIAVPVAATIAAVALVGYAINWSEVAGIALATPLWAVAACVLIVVAELAVAGMRLAMLARAMGAPLTAPASMSIWSVAHLAGLVLPTSIGNEVVKGGFLLRVTPNPVRVVGVLAIERMAATIALGLMVLATAPVAAWRLGHPLAPLVTAGAVAAFGLLGSVYLFRAGFMKLARRGARMMRAPEEKVDGFASVLARVPFASAVLLSLIIHLGTVALVAILLGAMGAPDPVAVALLGGPAAILVSLLPVSVGGFGVREGAFVLAFGLFGTQAAVAAGVGLAWWGVQVMAALVACVLAGAWFAVTRGRRVVAGT